MKPAGNMEGYRKICPICGKEFWAMSDWVYRRGHKGHTKKYYCSYRCIRKLEEKKTENGKGAVTGT